MKPTYIVVIIGCLFIQSSGVAGKLAAPKHKRLEVKSPSESSLTGPRPKAADLKQGLPSQNSADVMANTSGTDRCTSQSLASLHHYASPQSGKRGLYFLSGDTPQVFLKSSPDQKEVQVTDFAGGVRSYGVAADGERLWVLIETPGATAGINTELHVVNPKTGQHRPLITEKRLAGYAVWEPGGQWIAYSASENSISRIYRVDVDTGARTLLFERPGYYRLTDFSPDKRFLALIQERGYSQMSISLWDLTTKTEVTFLKLPPAQIETAFFSSDSQNLIVHSDHGTDLLHISRLKIATQTLTTLTFENDPIDRIAMSQNRKFLGYSIGNTRSDLKYGELGANALALGLSPSPTPVGLTESFSFSPTGELFFVSSAALVPPRILSWRKGKLIVWRSQTSLSCVPEPKLVSIASEGNDSFNAWYYPSSQLPAPTILYVHDGPTAEFRPHFQPWIIQAATLGFSILAPNVRGSTGRNRTWVLADDGEKRRLAMSDVKMAIGWIKSRPTDSNGSVGLLGEGYGAYVASAAQGALPLVSLFGYLSLAELLSDPKRQSPNNAAEFGQLSDPWVSEKSSPRTGSFFQVKVVDGVSAIAEDTHLVPRLASRQPWQAERLRWMGHVLNFFEKHRLAQQIDKRPSQKKEEELRRVPPQINGLVPPN